MVATEASMVYTTVNNKEIVSNKVESEVQGLMFSMTTLTCKTFLIHTNTPTSCILNISLPHALWITLRIYLKTQNIGFNLD